jgi:hypothetical protein
LLFFCFFWSLDDFLTKPLPKARSASSEEEDELLKEKKPLDFLERCFFFSFLRFSDEEVKKDVKPPTDLAEGRETSTNDVLDEESLRR